MPNYVELSGIAEFKLSEIVNDKNTAEEETECPSQTQA